MALVLKIGSLDLSSYLRVAHDEGLDPTDSAFSELQFTGSPAFSEGQTGVGEALGNREQVYPLIVKAASQTALHQLVRDINAALVRGAQVEYNADDSQNASTYFDLEGGKFEPEYQFWITRANRLRGVLRLGVRPFGHSGTTVALSSGILFPHKAVGAVPLKRIGGDVPAEVNILHGASPQSDNVFAAAIARSPSFQPLLFPAGAALGDPPRVDQYQQKRLPSGATAVFSMFVSPSLRDAYRGRHRAFALFRHYNLPATSVSAQASLDGQGGPTHVASQYGDNFNLADLGDISLFTSTPTHIAIPTAQINVTFRAAAVSSSIQATSIHFAGLVLLPLEESVVMTMTRGATPASAHVAAHRERAIGAGTPSDVWMDRTKEARGNPLTAPPNIGSEASSARRVIIVSGNPGNFYSGATQGTAVTGRERFRYLR